MVTDLGLRDGLAISHNSSGKTASQSPAKKQSLKCSQEHLGGRTIRHPQGRALGGSSAINNQAFIAPSQAGIDLWGKLNPGWDWATLRPYYQKCHTLTLPDKQTKAHLGIDWSDDEVRGVSGPIQASFPGVIQDPTAKAWVDAFKALKYGMTGDPFSGAATGGYSNATTCDQKAERSYAASAYYTPNSGHANLQVLCGAVVERIIFDSSTDSGEADLSARGVKFVYANQTHEIIAEKEVILAAGALQSPKLLELSGIGDAEILKSHGVSVLIPNPNVGENLQDHLMTGISYEVNDGVMTGDALLRQEPEALQAAMQMYMEHKVGPLAVGGMGSHAFLPNAIILSDEKNDSFTKLLERHRPSLPREAQHYHHVESILKSEEKTFGAAFMFPAQVNLHAGPDAKDFLQNPQPGNFLSLGVGQSHPLSLGSVHIASSSVSDLPLVDPRYLSNPIDMELLARQLLFIEQLAKTEPLSAFIKADGKRNHPSAHIGPEDLEAAKEYVRGSVISNHHPVGTCAMLPRERGGVVDPRLMVYGTRNVRVVDSSVMPFIPRGNIQSTVYAVAERAADLILADHHIGEV